MGIAGLLQGVKSTARLAPQSDPPVVITHSQHSSIRDFAHQSVAVDASSWLHKSVYSIADHYVETTERTGTIDARCVAVASKYVLARCHELLTYAKLKCIYLVMDGQRCPLKAVTNQERERRRQENLQQARAASDRDQMYEKYKACIKVKAELGRAVAAAVLRKYGKASSSSTTTTAQPLVQIIWAPYEADAQLVKVCVDGLAQAIITEDSDVLVYAATCQTSVPIVFKLDRNSGRCDVMSMACLLSPTRKSVVTENKQKKKPKAGSLEAFLQAFSEREKRTPGRGVRMFVQACVLAGCDYAPNTLDGVGTVSAFKFVRSAIHRDPDRRFQNILKSLPQKVKRSMNDDLTDYGQLLSKSEAVFYYHPVRDSSTGQVVYLNDPKTNEHVERPSLDRFEDVSFLGDLDSPSKPRSVAFKYNDSFNLASKPTTASGFPTPFLPSQHEDRAITATMAVANPYKKQKKRPLDEEKDRKPLQPKSPNEKKRNASKRQNPFAQFRLDKENPNADKREPASTMLEAYRFGEDVRFVKRVFPRNGTRATLPKPVIQPYARKPSTTSSGDSKNETEEVEIIDVDRETAVSTPESKDHQSTTSKFFPRARTDYARRVTMDLPPDPSESLEEPLPPSAQEEEAQHVEHSTLTAWNVQRLSVSEQFDLYDDFLSPKKHDDPERLVDDIIDSSPDSSVAVIPGPTSQHYRSPVRKAKSTIGPAKPIRFRFGALAPTQEKKERGVGLQREQLNRRGESRASFSSGSTRPMQTTLLTHFSHAAVPRK